MATINTLPTSATGRYIDKKVHPEIQRQYADEKEALNDHLKALELEQYFNMIASYAKYIQTGIVSTFPNMTVYNEFIKDLIALGMPFDKLFQYSPNDQMAYSKDGIKFEEDLQKIIDTTFGQKVSQDLGKIKISGKTKFTGEQLKNIPVRALDTFNETTNSWIQWKFGGGNIEKQSNLLYRQAGVQGKIDVRVPSSSVTIKYNYSPTTRRFINLLQGMNITAKNYTDMTQVSFGHANYFRVVSSIMESLGGEYSKEENILKIYYSTRSAKQNSILGAHKYHMRFVYELMGPGQYYDINGSLQSLGTTNFLIVYNKGSNRIFVRSTKHLARNVLMKQVGQKSAYINLTK